jgi:hypothetical protein
MEGRTKQWTEKLTAITEGIVGKIATADSRIPDLEDERPNGS